MTDVKDVKVVAPINMGRGLEYNPATKQYDVQISKEQYNLLQMKQDGLYLGSTPTRKSFYVDFETGDDNNDGTRDKPYKSVGKAIKSVEVGTVGTYIYLKEAQDHYLAPDVNNIMDWDYSANASYTISVYGENLDRIANKWYSNHLGYRTGETVFASMEYQQFKPTLWFVGTNIIVPNDELQRKYMTCLYIFIGTKVSLSGLALKCKNTSDIAPSAWFNSVVRGAGEVIFTACEMFQKDFENDGHFLLASSTSGELTVGVRYFLISGVGNLFAIGQYPLRVYSSYDTVVDESMNNSANPPMNYKGVATSSEIFALVDKNNPKSFITNK